MATKTILTGVKPTGSPHIGNYIGAIRPAIELSKNTNAQCLYFIADFHALTTVQEAESLRQLTYEVAATWLALGLDPQKVLLYRQSDVPEVFELAWILSCFTPKGLLNRAHAYKARVSENEASGKSEQDYGINVGLYSYPVLMASDIVLFDADQVPVGEDQIQHIEIARDIVQKINRTYGDVLKAPKGLIQQEGAVIPGLDGRKMSKSYNNTIPLFVPSKRLRKLVMKIKTDSSDPSTPKDPDNSSLFSLYRHFADAPSIEEMATRYRAGIGWGDAKQALFEAMDSTLSVPREKYDAYLANPDQLETLLLEGASKAREIARRTLDRVRAQLGARPTRGNS